MFRVGLPNPVDPVLASDHSNAETPGSAGVSCQGCLWQFPDMHLARALVDRSPL